MPLPAAMVVSGGSSASYYRCGDNKKRGTCTNALSVREDVARKCIYAAIHAQLFSPSAVDHLRRKIAVLLGESGRNMNRELDEHRTRLGRIDQKMFELLEAGVEPTQIVIRLRVPPDAVQALRAQWLDMVRNSTCQKCGQSRSVVCRACLVDVLDAPCPTCSRACRECAHPLPKGRIKCKDCGAWNAENGDGAAGDRAPVHAANGDFSGGNPDVR